MADKEERILITKCSSHCHALRISCAPFYDDYGMYCDKSGKWVRVTEKDCAKCQDPVLLGLSRSEVIERMAKAMCHSPFKSCEGCIVQKKKQACKQALEGMKELAEAALNSLLEEQK